MTSDSLPLLGLTALVTALMIRTCNGQGLGEYLLFLGKGEKLLSAAYVTSGVHNVEAAEGVIDSVQGNSTSVKRRVLATCSGDSCSMNRDMLKLVNAYRAGKGKASVCINMKLIAAATVHTEDMRTRKKLDHKGSDGSKVNNRVNVQKFKASKSGENIARGYSSAKAVLNAWVKDKGHRDIVLGDYTHTGAFTKGKWWTQVFAKSSSESCDT